MQPFRNHVMGKAQQQQACPLLPAGLRDATRGCSLKQQILPQAPRISALFHLPIRCRASRHPQRLSAVSESTNGNGKVHNKQLKFFYFDPNNPEEVREVYAKHRDKQSHHHANNNGSNNGYNGNGNGYVANGVHHNHGHTAGAQSHGHTSTQLIQSKDTTKDLAQVQRLSTQLEEARSAVAKLQQFEVLYKESRMRSKQMQVEVATLQQLLADKDAELARQYKRMEVEASERSGLRTQFNSAVDEVKALRHELEEARQAMLELRGVIPVNVTLRRGLSSRPSSSSGLLEDGTGSTGSSPDVLSSLQGLAKQLAEGMEHEVGSLFGGPAKRDL